jgi:hypothetical protein
VSRNVPGAVLASSDAMASANVNATADATADMDTITAVFCAASAALIANDEVMS